VTIDIANESGVAVDEVALASLARCVLDQLRIHPLAELSVLIVDEPAMAELHERWMGEPGPTDVLSFPMDELRPPSPVSGQTGRGDEPGPEPGLLGDVVLCPQVAAAQARTAGHSAQAELELLTVHGILHLLGYDHAEPEEHAEMFGLQDKLLALWRPGGHPQGPTEAEPQAEPEAEPEAKRQAEPEAEPGARPEGNPDEYPGGEPGLWPGGCWSWRLRESSWRDGARGHRPRSPDCPWSDRASRASPVSTPGRCVRCSPTRRVT
jgi:probable rRNA maturation factor